MRENRAMDTTTASPRELPADSRVLDVRRIPLATLARRDDADSSLANVLPDTRPGIVPTASFNSSI